MRLALVLLAVLSFPAVADAQARPHTLDVFGAVDYVETGAARGGALTAGTRWSIAEHVALSFDLGYGVIGSSHDVQDRWWLIPAIAIVVPAGDVRLDFGLGIGLGATSGYADMAAFLRGPFSPDWAFQLVPTVRGHVVASTRVSADCDAFVRLDVASLWLDGNTIGSRVGNAHPAVSDTIWATLSLGVAVRAL